LAEKENPVTTTSLACRWWIRTIKAIYICRCYREKDGKRHAYWALAEGYRIARPAATGGGLTVCAMEERGSLGVKRCAAAQDGEQANLFVEPGEPEPVEVDVRFLKPL
jgi:hypothetical protein